MFRKVVLKYFFKILRAKTRAEVTFLTMVRSPISSPPPTPSP